MVLGFLRPAYEQAAIAIQPRVGGLDDPAPGTPAGSAQLELDLLAAAADVRRKPVVGEQLATLSVVVAGIEAEALRCLPCGFRPPDGSRVEGGLQQGVVVAVGARALETDGYAGGLGKDRSLRPFLPRSVGLGPVLAPPRGALPKAPSQAGKDQSMPTASS